MKLKLPEPLALALPIVERLQEQHYEAVFVGGCVRDTLLGLPLKDVDIATSAQPEQVLELFDRCIPTGLQHGTVTVMQGKTGYEVTTFREESGYEHYRRPETVQFITSLEGDLLRRDFTVNAMALNANGELLDPYGGAADLQRSVLRCVGVANARFQEDALRMLRAVRFIGVYRFFPALGTWRALVRHRELLRFIAMERVQAELDKMLAGSNPLRGLHFTQRSGLLAWLKEPLDKSVLQAVQNLATDKGLSKHLAGLPRLAGLDSRYAAVAIALKLTERQTVEALGTLKFPAKRIKQIGALVACHIEMHASLAKKEGQELLRQSWLRYVLKAGKPLCTQWLELAAADDGDYTQRLAAWLQDMPISTLKELHLSGNDLTRELKRKAGPWLSSTLQELLFAVASGSLPNDRAQLLDRAKRLNEEVNDDEA